MAERDECEGPYGGAETSSMSIGRAPVEDSWDPHAGLSRWWTRLRVVEVEQTAVVAGQFTSHLLDRSRREAPHYKDRDRIGRNVAHLEFGGDGSSCVVGIARYGRSHPQQLLAVFKGLDVSGHDLDARSQGTMQTSDIATEIENDLARRRNSSVTHNPGIEYQCR
jgi:hypothetical protein